ncbi:uncharacterized protein LOC131168072 [Malania oleifera]|uniref:uncharacterized protein LOC131168072 n=1 Tax=Malania oleifera TaxID=397392 RepID=UPI0025AE5F4A|nr:uncharacterized protein LOC131168072 [Malania oleifera]
MADSRDSTSSTNITDDSEVMSGGSTNDNTVFPLSLEKLNGKNFREWAQSMKLVIERKGKLGYLTGERRKPDPSDAIVLQRWRSENSMVTTWLVNSMQPSIGKIYLFLPTAKEVWEAVHETYSDGKSYSQIFDLKTRLWQMRQGERGVTEYFMEMSHLWQELDLSIDEERECSGDSTRHQRRLKNERVFEFLAGLNRELDDVRGQILGRRPLP